MMDRVPSSLVGERNAVTDDMEPRVAVLEARFESVEQQLGFIAKDLRTLNAYANRGRGAIGVLITLGALVSAVIGAVMAWALGG